MARRTPQIRWTKNQLRELYRDVRAFNAARTKAINRGENENFLPKKLNVKELRKTITTAKQLKELTKDVDRSLYYKFETVTLPGYRVILREELERVRGVAELANKTKSKIAKQRGIKQKSNKQMGTIQQNDLLRPFKTDVENISGDNWDKFVQTVEARATPDYYNWEAEQYKEQYIESMWRTMGAGEEMTLELQELIEQIPAETILQGARDDPRLKISFFYPPDDAKLTLQKIEVLKGLWANYL